MQPARAQCAVILPRDAHPQRSNTSQSSPSGKSQASRAATCSGRLAAVSLVRSGPVLGGQPCSAGQDETKEASGSSGRGASAAVAARTRRRMEGAMNAWLSRWRVAPRGIAQIGRPPERVATIALMRRAVLGPVPVEEARRVHDLAGRESALRGSWESSAGGGRTTCSPVATKAPGGLPYRTRSSEPARVSASIPTPTHVMSCQGCAPGHDTGGGYSRGTTPARSWASSVRRAPASLSPGLLRRERCRSSSASSSLPSVM